MEKYIYLVQFVDRGNLLQRKNVQAEMVRQKYVDIRDVLGRVIIVQGRDEKSEIKQTRGQLDQNDAQIHLQLHYL